MTDPTTLPGWRWMLGMLTSNGDRVIRVFQRARKLEIDDIDNACGGESGSCRARLDRVPMDGHTPDPTDPATAGCLLALLGDEAWRVKLSTSFAKRAAGTPWVADLWTQETGHGSSMHPTLGAACIAVAERLGRWPGGAS